MNMHYSDFDQLSSEELSNIVTELHKKIDIATVKEFIPYTNEVVDYSPGMGIIFKPLETQENGKTSLKYDQYDTEIKALLSDCLRGVGCRTSYLRMDTLDFICKHKIESLVPELLERVLSSIKDNKLTRNSYGFDAYETLKEINTPKSIEALVKIGEIKITSSCQEPPGHMSRIKDS